jgi:hypothetical protein
MPEQDERRVYSLSDEHSDWADLDDLVPEEPRVQPVLQPLYLDGDTVDTVDDLNIYYSPLGKEAPHFGQGQAVEATPQEVAEWRAQWAEVVKAQETFRARMQWAATAYEAAATQALSDLAEATKPWEPVEADLKARSLALAAKLHEHREAAEKWEAERETKLQEHLDTLHGPRALVLYRPASLSSAKQADHIARVHLVTCTRRAKTTSGVYGDRIKFTGEGLRANDAWARLANPKKWIYSGYGGDDAKNMRVKFCAFCKPWTVFQQHLDTEPFPTPQYQQGTFYLGPIKLTDLPDAWTKSLKES